MANYIPRVVVKFFDNLIPDAYDDEQAVDRFVQHLTAGDEWRKITTEFPGITILKLITSVTGQQILKVVKKAKERAIQHDRIYKPPVFLTYFAVRCPPPLNPQALAERFSGLPQVELAYVESGPAPPPGVSPSTAEVGTQPYLGPTGINAEYAWGITGGDGGAAASSVQFVDQEQGWALTHEDLPIGKVSMLNSVKSSDYIGHGTAILGIVLAVPGNADGSGSKECVGIVPNVAKPGVVWESPYSRVSAIWDAINQMVPGDVLLLEAQTNQHLPVEVEDAVFQTIHTATQTGIVVVEPAANAGMDLDAYSAYLNRTSPAFRDSGAIMVASAGSPQAPTPNKAPPDSNFGSRVDCFAWADNIYTTGDGQRVYSTTSTTGYMVISSGTSGASAIIAGAAVALEGIAKANLGSPLDPLDTPTKHGLRSILMDWQTASAISVNSTLPGDWNHDRIGVMPDLGKIAKVLNLVPDIYIRDFVGDTGDPHTGMISASPDIILLPSSVANSQAAYGEGSGTENSVTLGAEAESGQDNYIYVRVRNRGSAGAENVSATVYWSPPATLVTPALWTLAGSIIIPRVPLGNILTVSDAIVWPAAKVPATGHYCFVGLVGNVADPAPNPTDFLSWDNFERFIRENNNVTWRNFNVVNNVPDHFIKLRDFVKDVVRVPFLITGPHDKAREMQLQLVSELPPKSLIMLEVPITEQRLVNDLGEVVVDEERQVVLVSIKPGGASMTKNILFPAKLRVEGALLVYTPEEHRRDTYDIYVRQLYKEREVGRITWRLAPLKNREKR